VDLPANILLLKIISRSLFLDKKSQESLTGVIKRKYKLAGNAILENYFFNILTRTYSACKADFTVCIEPNDWENKTLEPKFWGQNTYCDLTKCEILTKAQLVTKMKDKNNGFPFIAKLGERKFQQLQALRNKMASCLYISPETIDLIQKGISPMVSETLSKLHLD
jgi:hypothetical protein